MRRPRTLFVFPDSDRAEEAMVRASVATGFVDASDYRSLSQLLTSLEPAAWLNKRPASALTVRLLVSAEAPAACAAAFGDVCRSPSFAGQAQELFNHLRKNGASPDTLESAALQATPRLGTRARALAVLWRAVEARLDALKLVDRGALLPAATHRLLTEGLPERLLRFDGVTVQGVIDLFPAQLDFLKALAVALQAQSRALTLVLPGSGGVDTDVFLTAAQRHIESTWQALNADVQLDGGNGPLAWLGVAAFASAPERRAAPGLGAFCAATPLEEAREVARRVRALTRQGVAPEAIAVVMRDVAEDSEVLLDALADVGVPARARLGAPLTASAVGRLALGLLPLVEDGLPVDGVTTLLRSRYAPGLRGGSGPLEAGRLFAEAGIRDDVTGAADGKGAYAVRLEALRTSQAGRKENRAIGPIAQAVAALRALCDGLSEQATGLAHLTGFWRAVEGTGVFEAIRAAEPRSADAVLARAVDRALARDQAAAEALTELRGELEEALKASGLATRTMHRREFAQWLDAAAGDVNLSARGVRTGAVWLLDARELPGRRFGHVFFAGLVDGRFPGRPAPLPLLGEEERAELNRLAGAPLFRLWAQEGEVHLPLRAAEDRLLLHAALASAEDTITFSRARSDAAGKELLASPFLDALKRGADGFDVVPLPRSAVPGLQAVETESELRERAALEAFCPGPTRLSAPDGRAEALRETLKAEPWFARVAEASATEAERLRFFTDEDRAASADTAGLQGADLMNALAERLTFGPDSPLSAHQLASWGTCAFKGLLSQIFRLEEATTRGEELDDRERGTFWHDVLRRVVEGLVSAGQWPPPDAEVVTSLLEKAVVDAAAAQANRAPTGHPDVWRIDQRRAVQVVARFLADDAARPFEGRAPTGYEVRFGSEKADPVLRHVVLPALRPGEQDVHLCGTMDRVDTGAEGAVVLDYKAKSAGAKKKRTEALLVSDFQLPVYLLALRQWLGEAADASWLGVQKRETLRLSGILEAAETTQTLLATDEAGRSAEGRNLANAVHGLLGRLRAGDFSPRSQDCDYCSFKAVCRISNRQVHHEEEAS